MFFKPSSKASGLRLVPHDIRFSKTSHIFEKPSTLHELTKKGPLILRKVPNSNNSLYNNTMEEDCQVFDVKTVNLKKKFFYF